MLLSPFTLASFSILVFAFAAVIAVVFVNRQQLAISFCFPLAAIASAAAAIAGVWTVSKGFVLSKTIPLGLPDLPFHLRLDPLSGFFLVVIGLLGLFVSIYSIGYVKGILKHRPVTGLIVFYCIFLAGMFLVTLADDALFFMISWEVMAASSYFLVMFEDEKAENRRAAFIYLVIAHIGAIAILLSFGVMAGIATGFETFNGYTFEAMRSTSFPAGWATLAFLLAFFGFAAKAGIIPLHVWLPEAHPVAPSNVSALMSGVMLKTAIYGIIRITFDLIRVFPWWWGTVVLVLGLVSAVMGVLYALMQNDLKKLLAYSSVENIGIILIGIGMAMVFTSFHMSVPAALVLTAGLYHTLNHAMFKGLLFMGAGAVLHATNERNMEEMGGLIHKMPWTAALFLVGCISISALPPFNGFVSEWLTFQAFLLSPSIQMPLLNLLIPIGATLLALAAALAAACFVKAFGVTFLGRWREHHEPPSAPHLVTDFKPVTRKKGELEVGWSMRIGMMFAAFACLMLGIFPTMVIGWMDTLPEQMVGARLAVSAGALGWMWLTPINHERASYSGLIVFFGILSVVAAAYLLLHTRRTAVKRTPVWDCGFEKLTSRMQYSATAFSMPIRRIFGFLFNIKEDVRTIRPFVKGGTEGGLKGGAGRLHYHLRIRDRFWGWLYKPVADASFWVSRRVGRLQQGRIQAYLIYSFATIIALLLFFR